MPELVGDEALDPSWQPTALGKSVWSLRRRNLSVPRSGATIGVISTCFAANTPILDWLRRDVFGLTRRHWRFVDRFSVRAAGERRVTAFEFYGDSADAMDACQFNANQFKSAASTYPSAVKSPADQRGRS